jgi:hypothetical protein
MAPAHTLVAAVPADAVMELFVAAIPDQWRDHAERDDLDAPERGVSRLRQCSGMSPEAEALGYALEAAR